MNDALRLGLGERTVTVKRADLLEKLKENRETHLKQYQEAVAGYKDMARERLEKLRDKAAVSLGDNFDAMLTKIDRFDPEDDEGVSDVIVLIQQMSFSLRVPEDHTKSYDVAIEMAEWEVSNTVELTQSQFQCFVMDDWEWQEDFKKLSTTYANNIRR